ncbi:hypothetical protein AMECASPLE_011464 [Ameca splendens]|uniref:Uncharacterized protein n=1 Tax=Ameca splendens TaxID=208324 RepID=A0ABV0ZWP7_9TELE
MMMTQPHHCRAHVYNKGSNMMLVHSLQLQLFWKGCPPSDHLMICIAIDKWSGGHGNRLEWKCFSPVRCSDIVPHVTSSNPSCVSAKHPLQYLELERKTVEYKY